MSLELVDLTVRRGDFSLRVPEWQANAGAFSAVLGSNGAGKSSLFAALGGDARYAGEIRLHGRDLRAWPMSARARHVGVLPQQSQLGFAFTAEEVVALGLTPLAMGRRDAGRAVTGALAAVDAGHLAGRAFPTLSGGERQRVQLARVLLQLSEADSPPLLLLDEPTSAQDLGHQHGVLQLARELAREKGYIVVSVLHDLNQVLRYADRCLLLAAGAVVDGGRPADVLTPDRVEGCWGYRPERVNAASGRHALL